MSDENQLSQIQSLLAELHAARNADLIRLETRLQTIQSAIESLQQEISQSAAGESNIIAFY